MQAQLDRAEGMVYSRSTVVNHPDLQQKPGIAYILHLSNQNIESPQWFIGDPTML